ncbi:hypothetical protein LOAG_17235 [Loa loa]|nr:hypothetical protein LOAG_17235 [Loa loa]EJD75677.1 hypothetical protein LOAG_17235 [Loa loa]
MALKNTDKVRPCSEFKTTQNNEPLNRSIVKFAVEKEQPEVARVKLLLCNNSNRQIQWLLKCNDTTITAEPMTSGRIEKLGRNEVNLIWRRPKAIEQWANAPQPKLLLFMKLIAAESGKEVADAFTKFKAMIEPEAGCTTSDLPIHEVVIKSVKTSEQLATDGNDSKIGTEGAIRPESFLEDPDTLFWLIVFLCCFLGAVILQSISDGDRRSRRYDSD